MHFKFFLKNCWESCRTRGILSVVTCRTMILFWLFSFPFFDFRSFSTLDMFLLLLFHNLDFYRSVFVHLYCFLILLCSLFVKLANCNLFLKIFQIPPPPHPPSTSDLSVNHSCFRQGRSQEFVKGGLNFFFQGGSSAHVKAWKPPEINRFTGPGLRLT